MKFLFLAREKSQIAVIITFVIALLILFAVVFVNIAKVSEMKTQTSMAADRGALTAASQLGTLSNTLIKQIGATPEEPYRCSTPLALLIIGIAVVIAGVALAILTFGTSIAIAGIILGTLVAAWGGVTIAIYSNMVQGLGRAFQDMSTYSEFRESALVNSAMSIISDKVMVQSLYDPSHPDPAQLGWYRDDSTGERFYLKDSRVWQDVMERGKKEGMGAGVPARYIERFYAWYWGKRFPLVSEAALAGFIHTEFIQYLMDRMYIPPDSWDNREWKYTKLSFPVVPAAPAVITCGGSCPPWVVNDKVIVYGPVDLNSPEDVPTPENCFLGQTVKHGVCPVCWYNWGPFETLCKKIMEHYGDERLTYGADSATGDNTTEQFWIMKGGTSWFGWHPWFLGPDDAGILAVDKNLQEFTIALMQLANLPVSQRTSGLAGWLAVWYDYKAHPNGVVLKPSYKTAVPAITDSQWEAMGAKAQAESAYSDGKYTHDIYQRVYHACQMLDSWIYVLMYLDQTDTRYPPCGYHQDPVTGVCEVNPCVIVPDGGLRARIASPEFYTDAGGTVHKMMSMCRQGRGDPLEQCGTWRYCSCPCPVPEPPAEPPPPGCCDGYTCNWFQTIRYTGTYGTCTGSGYDHTTHPVCRDGDLYGVKPSWCTDLRKFGPASVYDLATEQTILWPNAIGSCFTDRCVPEEADPDEWQKCPDYANIVKPVDDLNAELYFQGEMSHVNDGFVFGPGLPTEVGQALEILKKLREKLGDFRDRIKLLADTAEQIIGQNGDTKQRLVYCWNDVFPGTNTNNNIYHMVNTSISGYPALADFPQPVTTKSGWWIFETECNAIVGQLTGAITLSVSRYDSDQSGFWWTFRRRKAVAADPDMRNRLESIRQDIMSDGAVNAPGAVTIVTDAAITSESQASFGPRKTDIKLYRRK
jgi:hypothetical protein